MTLTPWHVHHIDRHADLESDYDTIEASDVEDAAEKYAEFYDADTAEYPCVGQGETLRLMVRQAGTERWERWNVNGEATPVYIAQRAD